MVKSSEEIFPSEILERVKKTLNIKLPENYDLRPLKSSDFEYKYCDLLSQLTEVGNYNEDKFIETFEKMRNNGDYYIVVIVDNLNNRCVGASSLMIEYKFIHGCAKRAKIEEVVVDSSLRGNGFASMLIQVMKQLAIELSCYKVNLDCKDELIPFYGKFGFQKEHGRGNLLTLRF